MEEFAYLQLKKSDLLDIHRALLARWLIEDKLRQAQNLETVGPPLLLDRIEELLGLTEEASHTIYHHVEDELWEYSWYTYAEEWAWHRAEKDVHKELGLKKRKYMNQDELEKLIEKRYETNFEDYIKEIALNEDMLNNSKTKKVLDKDKKEKKG